MAIAHTNDNDATEPAIEMSTTPLDSADQRSVTSRTRRALTRPEAGGLVSAAIAFAFFAINAGSNGFLSSLGTADWLGAAAELGIVAVPIGMLMIAGEFDLSVGAMTGASSTAVAITTGWYGQSAWLGAAFALVAGLIVGLANGLIVIKTGLPSFIVTLATMLMLEGIVLAVSIGITGSSSVSAPSTGAARAVFASSWNHYSVSILWWFGILAVGTWVMMRTVFGNWAYATGGSRQAARLAGVPTGRVKTIMFMCTALGASLTGVIQTLSFANGNVTLGGQFVFTGIAAAVIGGVLLSGGYGSPLGTAFGAVTYGLISVGVFFLGWNADLTEMFIGGLLLLAVLANHRLRQLAMGRR